MADRRFNSDVDLEMKLRNLIFLAGIHGVGKTSLCQQLSAILSIKRISAGEMIRNTNAKTAIDAKEVSDVEINQRALLAALDETLLADCLYLMDGHFCLLGPKGEIHEIPESTFNAIAPKAILVIHDKIHHISERLHKRDGKRYPSSLLSEFQNRELQHAQKIAVCLGIPFQSSDITQWEDIFDFVRINIQ